MEDQGKRLLLAVVIIGVMYAAWTLLFSPKQPEGPAQPQQAQQQPPATQPATQPAQPVAAGGGPASQPASAPASAPTSQPASAPAVGAAPAVAVKDCAYETENAPTWKTPDWIATFTRCGGALRHFELQGNQYKHKVNDKEFQIDLVRADDPALLPLRTELLMPPSGGVNPEEKRVPVIPPNAEWQTKKADDKEIVFEWTSPDGVIRVTKTFTRTDPRYAFKQELEVKNVSERQGDKRLAEAGVAMFGYQDPNAPQPSMFRYAEPAWGTACYVDGKLKEFTVKDLRESPRSLGGDVRWSALAHQYFLLAVAPLENEPTACATGVVDGAKAGTMSARLSYATPTALDRNESFKRTVLVYAGPKILGELEGVSMFGGRETKIVEAVNLGWFGFLARPMLALLKFFHSIVANWGIAIILLTITVKLATLYWTTKSMRSMKALAKLKPEMDEIRKKYANDKQRLNTELMNMYKRHQISPFGGCLPMLLQMPVWIALFQTLRSAAELYRAPFAGWIHDLTAPDPLYILPITMTILMFVQARIQPAAVDSQQQKIMQWMMPAMFGFMSLVFPSGLALYMLTNSLLSMGHQLWMNKTGDKAKPAPAAPASASASASPTPSAPASPPSPSKKDKGGRKKMVKA